MLTSVVKAFACALCAVFIVIVTGCKDPACVTTIDQTVPMTVAKTPSDITLSVKNLDFLNDSTIVWDDIELSLTIKGKHTLKETLWLSLNGVKVARKDGGRDLESMTYNTKKNTSVVTYKMHRLFMNGAEPFHRFLAQIKKNNGQLTIHFYGKELSKNIEVVDAQISFKGKSYLKCPPQQATPTPTPTPVKVETTLDSVVPNKTKTASTTIQFSFSSNVEGANFMCSLDNAVAANCSSPQSYSNLSNGSHTFKVFAKSPQGGVDSTPASYTWTVDAVAPTVTITNAQQLKMITNSTAIGFEFSASKPDSTYKCSLDAGTVVSCSSPVQYSALAEGTHVFSVNATDSLGNVGKVSASFQWNIDLTLPETSFIDISPAEETSHQTTKSFTFSASESATFECSLDGAAFAACVSPVVMKSLVEGAHVMEARAIDAAGNVGLPVSYSWNIDLTAPGLFIGMVSPVAGLTNAQRISVEMISNEAGTLFCQFDGGSPAACVSPFVVSGLSEGNHSLNIYAMDLAGNQSAVQSLQWQMDFTAPVISFGQILPSAASFIQDAQVSLQVNAPDGVTLLASLNGVDVDAVTNPIILSNLAEGDYALSVSAKDAAGNTSNAITHSFRVDRTAPALTLAAEILDPLTNSDRNAFSLAASEQSTFECELDGTGFAACLSPIDITGLADGNHVFRARATDPAGNVSAVASYSWSVDTVAPTTSIAAQVSDQSATFTMSSSEANVNYQCSLDGVPLTPCSSQMVYQSLAVGPHSFMARSVDVAGNVDSVGATYQFVVTKPIHTTITSKTPSDNPTTLKSIVFTFEADQQNATFRCSLDGGALTACTSPASYNGLKDGDHIFLVKAVDAYGIVDAVGASYAWTIDSTGPVASNITIVTTTNTMTISWVTNEPATTQVRYGVGSNTNLSSVEIPDLTINHSIRVTGLTSNTSYSVQILGKDFLNNSSISATQSAKTSR